MPMLVTMASLRSSPPDFLRSAAASGMPDAYWTLRITLLPVSATYRELPIVATP